MAKTIREVTGILPLTPNREGVNPMLSKPDIQRNILAIKDMIESETNPESKMALKLRLVEYTMKLQGLNGQ